MWQTHDMGSGWWLLMALLLVALLAFVVWSVVSAATKDALPPNHRRNRRCRSSIG
jgi:hypothetical protein